LDRADRKRALIGTGLLLLVLALFGAWEHQRNESLEQEVNRLQGELDRLNEGCESLE
jgi:hypothetical protein